MRNFIQIEGLTTGYTEGRNEKIISESLNLSLSRGELVCLLGANGSGKSTLLRTVSEIQKSLAGTVLIAGKELTDYPQSERASLMGVVLTNTTSSSLLTVNELVLTGRLPYTGLLGNYAEADRGIAQRAMEAVGISALKERSLSQLSDGEYRKAMIARLLAQKVKWMILDEPSAYLDFPGKIELMRLLKTVSEQENVAVLLSTHDVEVSLQIADRIWLMNSDGSIDSGTPEDLIFSGKIARVFNRKGVELNPFSGRFEVAHESEKSAFVEGDSLLAESVKKALIRCGFSLASSPVFPTIRAVSEQPINIEVAHSAVKIVSKLDSIEALLFEILNS